MMSYHSFITLFALNNVGVEALQWLIIANEDMSSRRRFVFFFFFFFCSCPFQRTNCTGRERAMVWRETARRVRARNNKSDKLHMYIKYNLYILFDKSIRALTASRPSKINKLFMSLGCARALSCRPFTSRPMRSYSVRVMIVIAVVIQFKKQPIYVCD